MKKQKKYSGVIAPLITPVTESGQIDEGSVERLVDFVIEAKNYPFILGTTGEIASNSFSNRENLAKITVEKAKGRTTLFAGITDNCLNNSINAAKKYSDLGIDILVVHLPYFFPLNSDLMLKYFEYVADNSPRPIMIYNIVSITHMSIPIEVIEKLSAHPNIVGLKDSERDWDRHQKLAKLFKDRDFSLFIGWTNKSSEAILMGFDGIIPNTANIIPNLFQSLYEAAFNGNENEALKFQTKAEKLSELVQNNRTMTRTIPEIKAIMKHLNICMPYVLPPLEELSDQEAEKLINEFTNLDL
ncbi:4-hydroxy-tetrahydrodipicolinate synthase [hydrothermal vent metagenome]|uniref:4-hydroxy-tetrahydrodipicolinate synthase n=1 Tax=hydrothermal vent metagenome TaxID=652676 RepID=A0A3B1CNQ0_9ZZZZ